LEAGQSVPHVHVHVIPRRFSDFDGNNDEVYPVLETAEEELHRDLVAANNGKQQPKAEKFKVDADEDRPPRSLEEMEKEARWLEEVMKGID
jgi:bis(5'-adenosyl)-triphosphatase